MSALLGKECSHCPSWRANRWRSSKALVAQGRRSRLPAVQPCCSIRARWCIDVRFGVKLEAVALLQEWIRDLGSQAGLTPANTQLFSGSVGVPESRNEMEVDFDRMAELETFWESIPPDAHKAWSQRMQHYMLDGSPTWNVYRTCPSFPDVDVEKEASTSAPHAAKTVTWPGLTHQETKPTTSNTTAAEILAQLEKGGEIINSSSGQETWTPDAHVVLDWKGDPMKVNPGDFLPGV